jgi:hypothetical protein
MKPPSYVGPDQTDTFAEWLEHERVRTVTTKRALSDAIGADGTHQVGLYLSGEVLPLPKTLRTICRVMGVPWFVAFARAGYYRQILVLLDDLVTLAQKWCQEDDVRPPFGGDSFRCHGILEIDGVPATEAIKDDVCARRYVFGSYTDTQSEMIVPCIVPKPLAIALYVGTAGFPRRGDVYKDGRSSYAAEVLEAAGEVVNLADMPDDSRKPTGLLLEADYALASATLSFDERRTIAGEYVTAWCDRQCQAYTHYARLATFSRLGEAGSSQSTVSAYTVLPEIRIAECPDPGAFRL